MRTKINYQDYQHLPRVITGPGEYATTDGRTVIIDRRSYADAQQEWWIGHYTGEGYGRYWTYHGVRAYTDDPVRLVAVRPALQYIRSYRR